MMSPRSGTSVLGIRWHLSLRRPRTWSRPFATALSSGIIGAVFVASGCTHAPSTAATQSPSSRAPDEAVTAQHRKLEVERAVGIYDDAKLGEYVSLVGRAMAAKTDRATLPWSFEVIDDASVNAFALPEGAVFVTRGLLTHLNSEAELSAVLAHEIAHVTAKHAAQTMSPDELHEVGFGTGLDAMSSAPSASTQSPKSGVGLLLLKYGPDAERQADELAFQAMMQNDYNPRAEVSLFEMLDKIGSASDGGRLPDWPSTHPSAESELDAVRDRLAQISESTYAAMKIDRDGYLKHVDGVVYGADPRSGYFEATSYIDPAHRVQMQFPDGWTVRTEPGSIVATSAEGHAAIELQVIGRVPPRQAYERFVRSFGIQSPGPATEGRGGSVGAQFQKGPAAGVVAFANQGGVTFRILGLSPADSYASVEPSFAAAITSFGPLTDRAALQVQPARLLVVTVPRLMTMQEFNEEFPSSVPLRELAIINHIDENTKLTPGSTVKRVCGGEQPTQAQN